MGPTVGPAGGGRDPEGYRSGMMIPGAAYVLLEVDRPDVGWVEVASVSEVEPPGSISGDGPDGSRRVLLFGWYDDAPGVWESVAGFDVETEAVRSVTTAGLVRLSDLAVPSRVELTRGPLRLVVRFTLVTRSEPVTGRT